MKKFVGTQEFYDKLPAHAEKYIKIIMSTESMTDEDISITRKAVKGMYEAAGLNPLTEQQVVIMPSVLSAKVVAAIASSIIYCKENGKDLDDTILKTKLTDNSLMSIMLRAIQSITGYSQEVCNFTECDVVEAEKGDSYIQFDSSIARSIAKELKIEDVVKEAFYQVNGIIAYGNEGAQSTSFYTAFRYLANLGEDYGVDYSKWDHWERLSIHSGPRFVESKYCVISNRPEVLTSNEESQPHNETGPFKKYRDGSAIYALNGVYIPSKYFGDEISPQDIMKESNVEVRQELIKRYGLGKMLDMLNYIVVDTREDFGYALIEMDIGNENKGMYLKMNNPSVEGEVHVEGVDNSCKTVADALKDRYPIDLLNKYGYEEAKYRA